MENTNHCDIFKECGRDILSKVTKLGDQKLRNLNAIGKIEKAFGT